MMWSGEVFLVSAWIMTRPAFGQAVHSNSPTKSINSASYMYNPSRALFRFEAGKAGAPRTRVSILTVNRRPPGASIKRLARSDRAACPCSKGEILADMKRRAVEAIGADKATSHPKRNGQMRRHGAPLVLTVEPFERIDGITPPRAPHRVIEERHLAAAAALTARARKGIRAGRG
jgi:hypothetical protein